MKRLCTTIFITLSLFHLTFCGTRSDPPIKEMQNDTIRHESSNKSIADGRALSLRVLQAQISTYLSEGDCPKNLLELCGIKKLMGYVVDPLNKDIILFGKLDDSLPPLRTEDFVIALRNAWLQYAPLHGNTYIYSPPSCDIRPDDKIIEDLNGVMHRMDRKSKTDDMDEVLDRWNEKCRQLQKVTVEGIPPQTKFGAVMVEADYHMKKLVDGSDSLQIDGLESLMDMAMAIMSDDMRNKRQVRLPLNPLNRFEFYPGTNYFYEGEGIVQIKKSPVTLITEKQFLSQTGGMVGNGQADPLAQRFANSVTEMYDSLAKQKPIYAELEGLFRHVALAKTLKFKEAVDEAGLDIDYFLKRFPIDTYFVPEKLPGIPNIKQVNYRTERSNGYSEHYLWLPSCGGVQISIEVNRNSYIHPPTQDYRKIRDTIINTRTVPDQMYWDFPAMWMVQIRVPYGYDHVS